MRRLFAVVIVAGLAAGAGLLVRGQGVSAQQMFCPAGQAPIFYPGGRSFTCGTPTARCQNISGAYLCPRPVLGTLNDVPLVGRECLSRGTDCVAVSPLGRTDDIPLPGRDTVLSPDPTDASYPLGTLEDVPLISMRESARQSARVSSRVSVRSTVSTSSFPPSLCPTGEWPVFFGNNASSTCAIPGTECTALGDGSYRCPDFGPSLVPLPSSSTYGVAPDIDLPLPSVPSRSFTYDQFCQNAIDLAGSAEYYDSQELRTAVNLALRACGM